MKNIKRMDPKEVDFSVGNVRFFEQDYWEEGSEIAFTKKTRNTHGFLYLHSCDATVFYPDGTALFVKSGNCMYLPKGSRYRLVICNIGEKGLTLLINCSLRYEGQDHSLADTPLVIPIENPSQVRSQMGKLIGRNPSSAELKNCLWGMISLWITSEKREEDQQKKIPAFLKTAMDYIEENGNREISVAYLAKRCHVSSSYFRKEFRRYFGLSPKEFCLQSRLESAKHYLEMGELNVAEVSRVLEFSSPSYFSRLFKEKIGVSPIEILKNSSRR